MHDSTGQLQAVIEKSATPDIYDLAATLPFESALQLVGKVSLRAVNKKKELHVDELTLVGPASNISRHTDRLGEVLTERTRENPVECLQPDS
jgi:aspartyl-tRNA synthetase